MSPAENHTIPERGSGFLGQFVVFVKQRGTARVDLTHLTGGDLVALIIQDFDEIGSEQFPSNGAGLGHLVLGIEHRDRTGLGGAIALIELGVGEKMP